MTYADAAQAVRRAREARDLVRDGLYALQLGRLTLDRAKERKARGETAADPAIDEAVRALRGRLALAIAQRERLQKQLAAFTTLPAELESLRARIAAAPEASAALLREASALANTLGDQGSTEQRERTRTQIAEAQSKRAALAQTTRRDHAALTSAEQRALDMQGLREQLVALDAQIAAMNAELAALLARAHDSDLGSASERNGAALRLQRERVVGADDALLAAIETLYDGRSPDQLIAEWNDALPIVLLPLRIETRWKMPAGSPEGELLVRVFPDDIAVSNHEKVLTAAEQQHGQAYWTAAHEAGEDSAAKSAAWAALAQRLGANRAAWVALQTRPLNWDAAADDPALALQFPVLPLTKPDSWTTAPHSRVLPDRYVLLAWRGTQLVLNQVGRPTNDVVILGPSPLEDEAGGASIARDTEDQTLLLGESFRWVRDFDRAVDQGMAFRARVTADQAADGFDQLLVLGLKLSADAPEAQAMVETLIDDQHYSRLGFELLRQGTPTNNTDGNDSGYTRGDRGDGEASVAQARPPRFSPTAERAAASDGQRFADYLGLSYEPLLYATGADNADYAEAVAMNRALYAGTLGYFVDHMLDEALDDLGRRTLRRHFTDQVTGRGPIAAIKVGSQPYGILPTSSLARWKASVIRTDGDGDHSGISLAVGPSLFGSAATQPGSDVFETVLLNALRRFDQAWSMSFPKPAQIGAAGDPAANLLQILGLQPTSAEFHQRVGYSWDYLQNLDALAWGSSGFDAVLQSMMADASARVMLNQLGYTVIGLGGRVKPTPLLFQLIWRQFQTALDPKQLIDGRPLSESARVKPYDAAGTTSYLDWLFAHAADANALEAQNFGGAAAPGSLLYMMLRFSVLMEGARGIHQWLEARDVQADELVRSRKFMNLGAQASPSLWEVFRAPANRVVASEKSDQPLLALLHAPQLLDDAGRDVQQQRAALDALRALPTARLERALVEHIDSLSYRLDAWQTSLFTRRLHRQRRMDRPVGERRLGVYLGAYGYLERVRPASSDRIRVGDAFLPEPMRQGVDNVYVDPANGGYVHAPSLNHATAAALLRNGFLTHATPAAADALAVNMSSGRVQRAKYLLDGIRNGQSLEVLLGVQFERGLHDWTTRPAQPVILDQLKPLFRASFPILRTRVPQANDAAQGAAEVHEDYAVVNGLTLARTGASFPYGIAELSALSPEQQAAITSEKAAIADTLDALRDVLTTESAYQLALGNFDRAAAVLQAAGNGTVPPEVDVLATARGTELAFTQRLAVQFTTAAVVNPWPGMPLGERAQLEPALNAWLGDLLGAPAEIGCHVQALAADGSVLVAGGQPVEATVTVAGLGLQPIDFVYVVRSQVEASGAAELETRVRYKFARDHALADDVVVRIAFADPGTALRSFAEVLPLADRLRRLLGTARALDARHVQSASKDAPAPLDNPGRIDGGELRTRVGTRISAVRALFTTLANKAEAARISAASTEIDALRDALVTIANAGFAYAMPRSTVGAAAPQLNELLDQAKALNARAATLGLATDEQLAKADAASGAEQKRELLADAVKTWLGADCVLLPRFVFADAPAVAQADTAREELLSYVRDTIHVPLPVEEWLHGVACVRPLVHEFELLRVMADAARVEPLAFSPIQLPFRTGDRWLGLQYPDAMQVAHDTVSLVQHLPQGFDPSAAQCGLLIDEWVETVPLREAVTGLTFNFNAPNSAPPQALLLAITPHETGSWSWDDLVDSVLDTFRRARLRAVEPDTIGDMPGIGALLPAVIAEFSTSAASVSLDYSQSVPELREAVLALHIES